MVALFDPSELNPKVNITLRNLSLDKILQFVTQQVNFTYEVGADAVTIQPSDSIGSTSSTITEFFPISRATVIRLTGFRDTSGAANVDDQFGNPSASFGPSQDQEKDSLQKFFQSAGVNFEGVTGTSLAFDGEQLIVTQTPRNLERLRTILRNYSEVKQVEIETKFLEVSQNDLDEIGFQWTVESGADKSQNWGMASDLRSLRGYANTGSSQEATIIQDGTPLPDVVIDPPSVGQPLDYGSANALFTDNFAIDDVNVNLQIQALARKSGSDLMSAPKVTVLSGKRANIVVAQELRFPKSYGDIESTVSSGGGSSGSAAVSITAGTPQDFDKRNVGVEMAVTPNVENDNTISLILEPKVTEFEGFVEYGGPSIALSGTTTAIVPAGFYQPIFSTREITTEVTIYDGATVVMGGLTRDEVRTINDKVPFLGDIPGLGRLFRSEGETRQKKNLLIFVTANLVSPGGSLSNQSYDNIKSNTIYQSPAVATPSGGNFRNVTITE
jgi:general secretion pathway protein D